MSIIIDIILISLGSYVILLIKGVYDTQKRIESSRKKLKEQMIFPRGSGLAHGMVLSDEDNGTILEDSKTSLSWLSRLAN